MSIIVVITILLMYVLHKGDSFTMFRFGKQTELTLDGFYLSGTLLYHI